MGMSQNRGPMGSETFYCNCHISTFWDTEFWDIPICFHPANGLLRNRILILHRMTPTLEHRLTPTLGMKLLILMLMRTSVAIENHFLNNKNHVDYALIPSLDLLLRTLINLIFLLLDTEHSALHGAGRTYVISWPFRQVSVIWLDGSDPLAGRSSSGPRPLKLIYIL